MLVLVCPLATGTPSLHNFRDGIEHTATWFDQRAQSLISRYRKQYYQYLYYRHRDFDVKGLSTLGTYTLELDQVFVDLRIDPTTAHRAISNPIPVSQALLEGSHSICDYLAAAQLGNQHLAIIGPPGSGKTTLLKHITLALAVPRKRGQQSRPAKMLHKLPIFLFLRDHAGMIREQEHYTLEDAILDHLKKWEQPPPPPGWFKRQLSKGYCLVMLDGLDEVADPETRTAVVNWVERQMAACPRNRFLVTSRPFGYRSNPLGGVTVLEVRPFTTQQVERFIHQWYLANEIMSQQKDDPGVRMRAKAEATALLGRLRNTPALFDLTVNPLLLTMIAAVHRYGEELPGNRIALYAEIYEVFLGKRQQARGLVLELTPAQMQLVLEPLAYHLMVEGKHDITLDEIGGVIAEPLESVTMHMTLKAFLQLVENASGLLLERESGIYSFAHPTFQEYLAATSIRQRQLEDTLVTHVGEDWWRETILLYCAMADATPIVIACLSGDHPSASALELALACYEEAHYIQQNVSDRLETLLREGVEDSDPERQHVIAEALLARRLRQMAYLSEETNVDTTLITCAEYQVFLDEQRERGLYLQPDHWTSFHFPPGQGNAPVLGVRSSDAAAFCTWLAEWKPGPWLYHLLEAGELRDASSLSKIPAGTGYWLKDGQGFAWAKEAMMVPGNVVQELVDHLARLALALASKRALAPASASALARASASASASASTLASALDLARTSASALASSLDLDLVRISVSALASSLASARARALDRTNSITRVGIVGSIVTSTLAHVVTSDLINILFSARTIDLDRILALDSASDLTSALDRVRTLERARALDLDRALDRARTLERARTLDLDRALDRAHALALVLVLIYEQEMLFSRRGIRQVFSFGRARKRWKDALQPAIDRLLDIAMDLVILEKRTRGELAPCEGILIVKDRK